jgi:D-3-phosphoglycerate dehydrogenase / 2-oxoglutarate reductase
VRHSVNYPDTTMPRSEGSRLVICNANIPNMLGQISTVLADAKLNIIDMLNRSKGEVAFTLVDVEGPVADGVTGLLGAIDGVLSVRRIR